MTPKQIKRKLETLTRRQAALRDELRELLLEVEEHDDRAHDATESLEYAIERISELV